MIDSLIYSALWLQLTVQKSLDFIPVFGASCDSGGFFGFPTWHKYLEGRASGGDCVPDFTGINDIWLIVLAIVEILLKIAAIAAVIYVVYGGIKFITSRGNPEKTASARTAVIDALVGVVIAVIAIAVVNYMGGVFNRP